jgi:hypothetical protein
MVLQHNGMVDVRRHYIATPVKISRADPSTEFVDRLIQAAGMQADPEEINRPWYSHRGLAKLLPAALQSVWQPAKLGKPSDLVGRLQGRLGSFQKNRVGDANCGECTD